MAYTDRDTYGMYKNYGKEGKGPEPRLMGTDTLLGEDIYNTRNEDLYRVFPYEAAGGQPRHAT